ncbi:MAG: methyltransferase domain-containing protein [Acidimicrobiales bacterium]
MKPSAMLKLSRRRDTAPGRSPVGSGADLRPSLDDFVLRATHEAAEVGTALLELGSPGPRRSRPGPDRYRFVGLPEVAGARQPSLGPLPVDDEAYSVALCAEAVATSPEPQGLLTEINRVLVPAGRLFLTAPLIVPDASEGYLPWRARMGLNYLLEAAGFVIEEIQALERTRSYGVVAAKRRRPGHTRLEAGALSRS